MIEEEDIRTLLDSGNLRGAFERLVERLQAKVFRFAWSFVHDDALAEDLAQECLVKVWRALPSFAGRSSLSTWVFVICRNTCLSEVRRRGRRPTVSVDDPDVSGEVQNLLADPTDAIEPGGSMDIQAILSQLPEHYRQVLELFYLEQRSYDEVAVLMGLPIGTVKTYLFRARRLAILRAEGTRNRASKERPKEML